MQRKSLKIEDVSIEKIFAMIGRRFKRVWMVSDGTMYAESTDHTIVEANTLRGVLSELLYSLQSRESFEANLNKNIRLDV